MPRAKGWVKRPPVAAIGAEVWEKDVEGARLRLLRSKDDGMWHISISCRTYEGPERYPTWEEIKEARYGFLPDNITVAMLLPPKEEYVNVHETTFHLWELEEGR